MIPAPVRALLDQLYVSMLGTRDARLVPHGHRTWATRIEDDERMTIFIPTYAEAELEASLVDNRQVAISIGNPVTHEGYQLKGEMTELADCDERDRAYYEEYRGKLAAAFAQRFNAPKEMVAPLFGKLRRKVVFRVREVFEQTPGPGAGRRIFPAAEAKVDAVTAPEPRRPKETPTTISAELRAALEGTDPPSVITCSRDGTPNSTVISKIYYVDEQRVALSFQFFNKTYRNIRENPRVAAQVPSAATMSLWDLDIEFDHSETEGPIFDEMDMQIEAIASMTGMSGVFKLKAADIYQVVGYRRVTVD